MSQCHIPTCSHCPQHHISSCPLNEPWAVRDPVPLSLTVHSGTSPRVPSLSTDSSTHTIYSLLYSSSTVSNAISPQGLMRDPPPSPLTVSLRGHEGPAATAARAIWGGLCSAPLGSGRSSWARPGWAPFGSFRPCSVLLGLVRLGSGPFGCAGLVPASRAGRSCCRPGAGSAARSLPPSLPPFP